MKRRRGSEQSGGESLIPLVLIAVLAVFVAAKFGFIDVSGVPILSALVPAPVIKVGVIGRASSDLKTMLETEVFRVQGIRYAGDIPQNALYAPTLDNFDIIIVQGTTVCDRTAREVISDRVKGGGKLIIVGDACTRVTDDPNAVGWDVGIGTLGDVVPAVVGGPTHEREPIKRSGVSGKFKVIAVDHPIFNGIKNFGFHGNIVEVYPKSNSKVLAFVDESASGRTTLPAQYAILESRSLLAGKVIYLAYEPTQKTSREMFLNMLLYLKGSKG
ncbi:MAG: hypothetical protein ACE5DI_01600 [Candidatus Micrarchaeia archaeon]